MTHHVQSGFAQGSKTVLWQYEVVLATKDEAVLKFTAQVEEGWHLYSQHMSENGPMPTRFSFVTSKDYVLLGQPVESGKAVKFYDDVYAAEITWYSGKISFNQKIKLLKSVTTVKGNIEYMTCNEYSCVPSRQDFSLQVPSKKNSI